MGKNSMPKISVLMSVYNCENTVRKSIDSIIDQTFQDWEFIICDDGSLWRNTLQCGYDAQTEI